MKRLVVVLGGLLALPAFAEVSPFIYADEIEYVDDEYEADDMPVEDVKVVEEKTQPVVQTKASPRVVSSLRSGSRSGAAATNVAQRRTSNANSRVVAARTTTSRTTATPSRTTASRAMVSRGTVSRAGATNNTNSGVSTRRATSNTDTNVARAGTATTPGAIILTTTGSNGVATMQPSGGSATQVALNNVTYSSANTEPTRVGVRGSARVPTIRVASASMTTSESSSVNAADTAAAMDELAQLTDYCKAQYVACMDNFCNVLDDNQGRCSCSKNIQNYAKTEEALKAATEELQDVAQKIQYIGLTGDEITTLFTETEAEEEMRGRTDTSQIKTSLDKVRDMIIDVKTGTASGTYDSALSFDLSNLLDFTISSTGFDLSGLFGTASTNTSSISNQRGETLYKTGSSRCKASVLNTCAAQGVDISVITNSYDLEIDKQCIAYERSLSDANDQMTATVRNAKTVLQKARLMVSQQRNQYDLRGCVSALDSCMQDDYVCGADYENCLDPTGKYIVNGAVVVGSLPGRALTGDGNAADNPGMFKTSLYKTWCADSSCSSFAWDYDGSQDGNLSQYINNTLSSSYPDKTDTNMSKFLQYKIGYNDSKDGKNYGMCMSVLNKCQNYTYDNKRKYKPDNQVISEYLYRTMIQIKAAQDEVLSNYAESCITDVTSCLNSNGYDSATNKNIPVNACKSLIVTCMSVNGNVTTEPTPAAIASWANEVYSGVVGSSTDANTGTGN